MRFLKKFIFENIKIIKNLIPQKLSHLQKNCMQRKMFVIQDRTHQNFPRILNPKLCKFFVKKLVFWPAKKFHSAKNFKLSFFLHNLT